MPLEKHEEEVLKRMYIHKLIGYRYQSIEKVSKIINWGEIAREFDVKKSLKGVLRKLKSKGYIDDHGKSMRVASLTRLGVAYAEQLIEEEF